MVELKSDVLAVPRDFLAADGVLVEELRLLQGVGGEGDGELADGHGADM